MWSTSIRLFLSSHLVLEWKGRGHEKAVSITYYRPYLSLARSPNYNYLGEWTSKPGLIWPLAYASFHSFHGNSNMSYSLMYCGNECCFCLRLHRLLKYNNELTSVVPIPSIHSDSTTMRGSLQFSMAIFETCVRVGALPKKPFICVCIRILCLHPHN